MAYDLMIGKSALRKDNPIYLGSLNFEEQVKVLTGLQERFPLGILSQLTDPFTDLKIENTQLIQSKDGLYKILQDPSLKEQEREILYKIIAIIGFAIDNSLPLFGVAD
jgi:hypothetical protein